MSRLLSTFIPCMPPKATSQQKGQQIIIPKDGSKPFAHHFKKKRVEQAENDLIALLRPYAPSQPFEGALWVSVGLFFPWRGTEKKSVVRDYAAVPIVTRPDCSNLIKMLEDAMTVLGYWRDDSQNAGLTVCKYYADRPGIYLDIETMEPVRRSVPGEGNVMQFRVLPFPFIELQGGGAS